MSGPADIERAFSLCLRPPPGNMAGIFGEEACPLALRALALPLLRGETVVAVDGGNRFDPYEIGKAARALGGDGKEALSRILVSRAFTCHQMEALLVRRLPAALERYDAGLALILGLPESFTDADVPYAEACRLFRSCLSALRRVAGNGVRVVAVGRAEAPREAGYRSPAPPPEDRSGFFRRLAGAADPALFLRREEERWAWEIRSGPASARSARGEF